MTVQKWRPSIGMITAAVIASVLVLPLVGLLFFRLFENQLVRQTESELIAQAAMLAAIYAREIEAAPAEAFPLGARRPPSDPAITIDERYAPILPTLDLAMSPILPARPPAMAAPARAPAGLAAGAALNDILAETQRTTLAGFRLLDAEGVVVAGREDIGRSFAHVAEVRVALAGRFQAAMRVRNEDVAPPPLYSISRGAKVRVFVAFPVFLDERVRGVVYVSRTPDNILRALYRERDKVTAAAILMLLAASGIGYVFVRTIARPVRELSGKAQAINRGDVGAIGPLRRHGTREIASLTDNFMIMAKRLSERSAYLSGFANHVSHELKTPLTAIRGAAELMRDDAMTPDQRDRFLHNVLADAERIEALLERLREMARADNPALGGSVSLEGAVAAARLRFPDLGVHLEGDGGLRIGISPENAGIILGQLLDNAQRHGAANVAITGRASGEGVEIVVADDGQGVSEGNRARIFEPFFTTRRAEGGTGMGLGIVAAMLSAHGGSVALGDSERGATFVLQAPAALRP